MDRGLQTKLIVIIGLLFIFLMAPMFFIYNKLDTLEVNRGLTLEDIRELLSETSSDISSSSQSQSEHTTFLYPNSSYKPLDVTFLIEKGDVKNSISSFISETNFYSANVSEIELYEDWEFGPSFKVNLDDGSSEIVRILDNKIYSATKNSEEVFIVKNVDLLADTELLLSTLPIEDSEIEIGIYSTRIEAPNSSIGIDMFEPYKAGFFVYENTDTSDEFLKIALDILNSLGLRRGYFYTDDSILRYHISQGFYSGGNRVDPPNVVVITSHSSPDLTSTDTQYSPEGSTEGN